MPGPRNDRLSKAEIRKDALQDGVTAASHVVGTVTTILTTAVSDVARAMGGFATEIFEIRDSTRRAKQDHEVELDRDQVVVSEPVVAVVEDTETNGQPKDS